MSSTSQRLSTAAAETCPAAPGVCRTCERTGLPLLLLRKAVLPTHRSLTKIDPLGDASIQSSLRMLREGYVYVLLDRKQWQAYQVTPEGFLRQFNPYEMPRSRPAPLSKQCLDAGHDLRASFLRLDTRAHRTAWIAFAQDPWPSAVLDAYKTGKRADGTALPADFRQRFVEIELAAVKADPTAKGGALALEHAHPLAAHVAEYATGTDDFGSVHGWYPRHDRLQAMRDYLRILERQEGVARGVAGVILPDPVGMAHELDNLRLSVRTAMQRWAELPSRRYKFLTSQALLGIKALIAQRADAETADNTEFWSHSEMGAPPVFRDPAEERADIVKGKTRSRVKRLEERYREGGADGRAAFQRQYDDAQSKFQQRIDAYAKDWATQIDSAAWKRIVALDYTDAVARSVGCRLKTVADCLAGGVTDAVSVPPPPAKPDQAPAVEVLGPSGKVWQQLLNDPLSPAYIALQGQQTSLYRAFAPLLGGGAMPTDAGKKYFDTLKGLVGSDEVARWRERATVDAADHLLIAMHNAAGRLDKQLGQGVKAALDHLYVGAAWLYGNARLTQVKVQLTVGECFNLIAKELRSDTEATKGTAARRVRAMVFSGLIAIPDSALRNVLIDVTVWTHGTAEEVKRRLAGVQRDIGVAGRDVKRAAGVLGRDAQHEAKAALRQIKAGLKNLEPAAQNVLKGLQVTGASARHFAGSSLAGLKRLSVTGVDGGLSLISLYFLHDSLKSSLADLDARIGDRHPEAVAAFYGAAVGLMGAGVEGAGMAIKMPADAAQAFARRWGAVDTPRLAKAVGMGEKMVRAGGVIAAVGGIADGAANMAAAVRTARIGDKDASEKYIGAGILSIVGAGFSITGAVGAGVLMGPLGIGIVIGIVAFAVAQIAKSQESNALELWARHCHFGSDDKYRHWGISDSDDPEKIARIVNSAIAALNAAVLGMEVALGFERARRLMDSGTMLTADIEVLKNTGGTEVGTDLVYRILLPGFDPAYSGYRFTLEVQRFGLARDGRRTPQIITQVLAAGQMNANGEPVKPTATSRPDYVVVKDGQPTKSLPLLTGRFELEPVHGIQSVTLKITYWPDKSDESGFAEVVVMEVA
ncbi:MULTISPECIES: T6SS effector BTH_I2691 family protein [unclassified Burkholderia]|uniref:T6SS effector BTH_I2691 family protein n=1 Tax=unclassified Burkholderia TaxID=2613784 RepID=UPI000A8CFEBD|nr:MULTISPECIES: T6SS effector BTH_I2691 family protein [unclassified Burkholderia]